MLHSFGGRTKLIPAVKTKCMPLNTDKVWELIFRIYKFEYSSVKYVLNNRLEIIINIEMTYFVLIVLILIGNGKKNSKERKWSYKNFIIKKFDFCHRYLQAFQKVRNCSHIHEHSGTSARIQVLNNRFRFIIYSCV